MELVLNEKNFVNGKYSVKFAGNREALFTIVDEEFPGNNTMGRVNKIVILVRELDEAGNALAGALQTSIIGLGNQVVGVMSALPELRGKTLSRDNMARCTIILYEPEGE